MNKRIIVLGAGIAGLSFAYHAPFECIVYEKEKNIGGLCRSFHIESYVFDYCLHVLHLQTEYVKKLLTVDLNIPLQLFERSASCFYKNAFYPYPFQQYFTKNPQLRNICMQEILDTRLNKKYFFNKKDSLNFEQWAKSQYGDSLYKEFIEPYNTKFWNYSLTKMHYAWTNTFFPKVSIEQMMQAYLSFPSSTVGYNRTFFYPKNDTIEILPKKLTTQGSFPIVTNYNVDSISLRKKQISFDNGEKVYYNRLINSIPLPTLLEKIVDLPETIKHHSKDLAYNSVLSFCIIVKTNNSIIDHWIYYSEKKYVFYRISNGSEFLNKGYQTLYVEITHQYSESELSNRIAFFKKKIIKNLIDIKYIQSKEEIKIIYPLNIKYGYVVFTQKYYQIKKQITEYLASRSIHLIGRYGSWDYMSLEDVILDGKNSAETIAKLI